MNDFSKEELENILFHLGISLGQDEFDDHCIYVPGLYEKVRTMIDNYCEHNPRDTKGAIGMYHCPVCGDMQLAGMRHIRLGLDE